MPIYHQSEDRSYAITAYMDYKNSKTGSTAVQIPQNRCHKSQLPNPSIKKEKGKLERKNPQT